MLRFFLIVSLILLIDNIPVKDGIAMNEKRYSPNTVNLFLAGDVMTGRGVDQILPSSVDPELHEPFIQNARRYVTIAEKKHGPINAPVQYEYMWKGPSKVLNRMNPEFTMVNLETAITKNDDHLPNKRVHYRMHPDNVKTLSKLNIDICSLANNHTMDWKEEGLVETLETLREANIAYTGAGESLAEAKNPAIHNTLAGSILVFGYGTQSSGIKRSWKATKDKPGLNTIDRLDDVAVERIKKQVDSFKQRGDLVILSIHWGENWGYEVPHKQRQFAHDIIDKTGVDMIHGHSTNHPKGLEVYKKKLILYSAGDFINDFEGIEGYDKYPTDISLMYFPEIDLMTGELISLNIYPMELKRFQLRRARKEDVQRIYGILAQESAKFQTKIELNGDVIEVPIQ